MKKSNGFIIFMILLLSIIFVVVLFMMIYLFNNKGFHFMNSVHEEVYEKTYSTYDFDTISLSVTSADIFVKESDTSDVKVEIYGEENSGSSVIRNRTLEVGKNSSNGFCFGFCFNRDEVYLYLPKDIMQKVKIKSSSGDIRIGDFSKLDLDITTSSGDIEIDTVASFKGGTNSGEVDIHSILKDVDITTHSGDVTIDSFRILNDSSIATHSGDVSISAIGDCYIDTHTNSGDVDIKNNNRFASVTLNVETRSGDIDIR